MSSLTTEYITNRQDSQITLDYFIWIAFANVKQMVYNVSMVRMKITANEENQDWTASLRSNTEKCASKLYL